MNIKTTKVTTLRGIKPKHIQKRLKVLFYGSSGVGKTMAAIGFPAPYLIDTERGAENDQYLTLLEKNNGVVFQTTDAEEVMKEIKTLLTEEHPFKTVIIDPITTLYNDLLDKAVLKLAKNGADGTEFGRHYSEANKHMKQLLSYLMRLDMNVIITSHAKNEYGKDLSVIGQTFDAYKKLDYFFDLVFEVQKRGAERFGIARKSRVEAFPDGATFPFSYDEIANRYGRDILEKMAQPEILALPEEIEHLKYLIDLYKEPEEIVHKWLAKANASCLEDITQEIIQKLIAHMESKGKSGNVTKLAASAVKQ